MEGVEEEGTQIFSSATYTANALTGFCGDSDDGRDDKERGLEGGGDRGDCVSKVPIIPLAKIDRLSLGCVLGSWEVEIRFIFLSVCVVIMGCSI